MAKVKTIFRQVDQLFSMSRSFGQKKKALREVGQLEASVPGSMTYDVYRGACMRFAEDLAERRGINKFQICSITPEEVQNFLERLNLTRRPETVHQYSSALRKLEEMTNKRFGKVSWEIDKFERPLRSREDVTIQRGPAYTPEEADILTQELRTVNPKVADALEFIRATGCRAESIFGVIRKKGGKVVKNGVTLEKVKAYRDFEKVVTSERIDLVRRTVTLMEKGGKVREVAYDGKYQGLMERLVRESPRANLFAEINQQTTYKHIKFITLKSGIQGRGFHGMRKTFAVQRYRDYISRIKELIETKDWQSMTREFPVSIQKAKRICEDPADKVVDVVARLRLSKDLGHNRVEVTYRYVPKKLRKTVM